MQSQVHLFKTSSKAQPLVDLELSAIFAQPRAQLLKLLFELTKANRFHKLIYMTSEDQKSIEAPLWLRVWRSQQENFQLIFIALCLALLIRAFIAEPRYIPSDSMLPTLHTGDRLVVEKLSYRFQAPATGDIVVFHTPQQLQAAYDKEQAFIKRVIATPQETVGVTNGKVYLNNHPLQENYIAEPPAYRLLPQQVPEHNLFVMGDNRNDSNDSHVWGFLPEENVIGRARFRFWPLNRIGFV